MSSLIHEVPRIVRFIETESKMLIARDGERANGELFFSGHSSSVWEHESSGDGWW